ncbi:MAG: RNA polymerase sigma factor [Bradymonadia bacterium]
MRISREEETKLVARARLGDEIAFAQLTKPLRDKVYWRALKAIGDADEAEDIAQETMVRAFTRLETFRGDSRFSSWLYMVCSNCIRMHLRTKRRKGALSLDDHIHEYENSRSRDTEVQPDQAVERTQLFDAIGTAMSQLPPQYGSILVLWVHEGLDLNEIKERSGLSIAAIKSRIHRARGRVRQQIEHRFGEVALLAA